MISGSITKELLFDRRNLYWYVVGTMAVCHRVVQHRLINPGQGKLLYVLEPTINGRTMRDYSLKGQHSLSLNSALAYTLYNPNLMGYLYTLSSSSSARALASAGH